MYIGGKKDADKPEYIRKSMCEISEVELCKAFRYGHKKEQFRQLV